MIPKLPKEIHNIFVPFLTIQKNIKELHLYKIYINTKIRHHKRFYVILTIYLDYENLIQKSFHSIHCVTIMF